MVVRGVVESRRSCVDVEVLLGLSGGHGINGGTAALSHR